ncbi:MAG: hypothetical protein CEE38_12370 [Planctomycetes bacterium B3_Pla]|nr:MAG: hypothetical protein CEE38_12370 [Planctomycetes bacterium B3_Pla]
MFVHKEISFDFHLPEQAVFHIRPTTVKYIRLNGNNKNSDEHARIPAAGCMKSDMRKAGRAEE